MCFAVIYVLNKFLVEIGKIFVGAGGGVTRPYKSLFRGGPGGHLPLKINLLGQVMPPPASTNPPLHIPPEPGIWNHFRDGARGTSLGC